jgi:hypothetical protein
MQLSALSPWQSWSAATIHVPKTNRSRNTLASRQKIPNIVARIRVTNAACCPIAASKGNADSGTCRLTRSGTETLVG